MQDSMEDTESASPTQSGNSLFKKACDTCRSRKVKCDKESPCSACTASKLPCRTTDRREGVKRKRIHVSDDYERKIDLIEAKLAGLDQVLQSRPLQQLVTADTQISNHLSSTTSSGEGVRHRTLFSDSDQPDVDGDAYEGDTSLNAHSIQARALVERALGQGFFASTSPEVSSAISSLRDLSNGTRTKVVSPLTPKHQATNGAGFDYRKLPLPPTNKVLEILRRSKETQTVSFDMPFSWMSLTRMTEFCRLVFFSIDDYPASTAIIVFGNLYLLFQEFSWRATDDIERVEYRQYADLCRSNFEICISNLDILLPATLENVEALLLGASHGVETSRLNVSWKLKSIALTLIQALGLHRAKSIEADDPETQLVKEKIFWFFYMMDKGLSLRLGRASTFQDYDIDLPYPNLGDSELDKNCTEVYRFALEVARVQGLIYEQIYSPGALKESDALRRERAQFMIAELNSIRAQNDAADARVAKLAGTTSQPPVYDVLGALSIYQLSDNVTHYTNLTMLYRAIPPQLGESSLSPECLQVARLALEQHQFARKLKNSFEKGMWSQYLAWTILYAPFTPFLVIFSNVLATANTDDLARLHDFVDSISDSDFSNGARKMHHVCEMFYRIAKLYVLAKQAQQPEDTAVAVPSLDSTPYSGGPDLNTLNPYLNAIGFAGDPMLDLNNGINPDAGDWFQGNQWVMGLLDDDLNSMYPPQM